MSASPAQRARAAMRRKARQDLTGQVVYLAPWWVEIVEYSECRRNVRFRRLARAPAPLEWISVKRFANKVRLP